MSWKKNAFSFFIWLLYIVFAGTSLICSSAVLVDYMGFLPQYGILCAGIIAPVEGLLVMLVHKLVVASTEKDHKQSRNILPLVYEALVVLAFLAVGIWGRIEGLSSIANIDESMTYFQLAQVTSGQSIPQVVHGAVYFYLQLLHLLFMFLGNKIAMAFWMQVILQIIAVFILYRAVRRMIGRIPSVIMFALLMCSTWMIKEVLFLSPNMMLLLCFAIVLWTISLVAKASRIRLGAWLVIGALVAVVSYMDIIGLALLIPVIGVLFSIDVLNKDDIKKSVSAVGMSVLGFIVTFFGIIIIDAVVSGKNILNILLAWFEVYSPDYFQMAYTLEEINFYPLIENVVIFALLLIGVFSFWCRKEAEDISLWVCGIILILLAQCFQLTTTEVDGRIFLYVFIAILISIGIAENFAVDKIEEKVQIEEIAETADNDIEIMDVEQMTSNDDTKQTVIEYIPNPLPLPKKHEKRVLDYAINLSEDDDFDFKIEEDDDFDI